VTRDEMGKLVFAAAHPADLWQFAHEHIRERCMLAAEAVDRASRADERLAIVTMLYAVPRDQGRDETTGQFWSNGYADAADMIEARNTEGVE
jgi:hypothetical protein